MIVITTKKFHQGKTAQAPAEGRLPLSVNVS